MIYFLITVLNYFSRILPLILETSSESTEPAEHYSSTEDGSDSEPRYKSMSCRLYPYHNYTDCILLFYFPNMILLFTILQILVIPKFTGNSKHDMLVMVKRDHFNFNHREHLSK